MTKFLQSFIFLKVFSKYLLFAQDKSLYLSTIKVLFKFCESFIKSSKKHFCAYQLPKRLLYISNQFFGGCIPNAIIIFFPSFLAWEISAGIIFLFLYKEIYVARYCPIGLIFFTT